jgi:HipA-like protein
MDELIVYLCGDRAGRLILKDNGNLQFRYDAEYRGPPVSQSMPVQAAAHPHNLCRAVFGGLLRKGTRARRSRATSVSPRATTTLCSSQWGETALVRLSCWRLALNSQPPQA